MSEVPWKIVSFQNVRTPGKPGLLTIVEPAKIAAGFFPNDAAPRVYWIRNDGSDWITRGGHYHPEGGKRELLVALAGRIRFELHAEGVCGDVWLDRPELGLLIPSGVWHRLQLSPGALLLSIASTLYRPDESVSAKPCACDSSESS
ncbi:MAG: WxcM-like domain-containing protein [Patescibacteria group bacterium]|jgi:hypothetical protein